MADYRGVDPCFGTLADADALFAAAHDRGLRVIVDLVPNHTSIEHAWFRAAVAAPKGSPERERYLFRDGLGTDGEEPPNDWQSVFSGPAWTRLPDGQWYLHLFDSGQPDLNWDNPEVRAEFEDIIAFWLGRGADGLRIDVADALVKAPGLPDEAGFPLGTPTRDQEGVHEVYQGWRRVLERFDGERVLVAEAWVSPVDRLARYVRSDEMHQAFNFEYLLTPWVAGAQRRIITESLAAMAGVGAPATWVLSNHDVVRHASRLGFEPGTVTSPGIGVTDPQPDRELGLRRARAATLLILGLPGSVYLYQGEELGLPEATELPDETRQDPIWRRSGGAIRGRDGCRVPLPWAHDAPSFGFGPSANSWLPQPADWADYALDVQAGTPGSTYEFYREALARFA